MSAREAYDALLGRWAELSDLGSATALLAWDQETKMPKKGTEGRGGVSATLAGIIHERLARALVGFSEELAKYIFLRRFITCIFNNIRNFWHFSHLTILINLC